MASSVLFRGSAFSYSASTHGVKRDACSFREWIDLRVDEYSALSCSVDHFHAILPSSQFAACLVAFYLSAAQFLHGVGQGLYF